jgi:hypothetical protein
LPGLRGGASVARIVGAGAAAFVLLFMYSGEARVSGVHAEGADNILMDLDPAGNTATSIGSIETRARIDPNGLQDADEDRVDEVEVDIVAGPMGIPATAAMIGFRYEVHYGAGLAISFVDYDYLLGSRQGSSLFPFGDFVPDVDGKFVGQAVDLSDWATIPAESGPGVLSRIAVSGADADIGVHALRLGSALLIDTQGEARLPHNSSAEWAEPGAHIAVGTACPPATDLVAGSAAVSLRGRTPVGAGFDVTVTASFTNSGTSPVNGRAVVFLAAPPECTVVNPSGSASLVLTPGSSVSMEPQVFEAY